MRTLTLALILGAFTLATPVAAQDLTGSGQTPRPTLLMHGHYCGPGNDGMDVAPIDALDAACRKHYACTPDGGLPSCGCNRALKRDAGRVAASPREPQDLRAVAGLVAGATDLMLCSDDVAGLRP
ncbi:hypothetical protein ASF58_15500 [Methylobacterium sp. Leaf125]|uniref:hypothetical protein n=1 Tax=Methylobacterium sp. Leaf125 TaxID=1736265 RepID=UPI0006FCD24E|nr:hypothetical protein [Methylobacterium sp. Leaf125]KQQ24857.1 hypothetical protein ASF58_15500 [Methylobacterium sp. Leaf125]